jgi:hypothetical protein
MTSTLAVGEWSAARPGPHYTHGKDPVPIVQEAGWASEPVWTGAENLAPHRDSIPDRPARSQSLYRLSCPAHTNHNDTNTKCSSVTSRIYGYTDYFVSAIALLKNSLFKPIILFQICTKFSPGNVSFTILIWSTISLPRLIVIRANWFIASHRRSFDLPIN